MNKFFKQIIFIVILIAVLILPYFVFAQNPAIDNLKTVGPDSGYAEISETNNLTTVVGVIVNSVFGLLGVIFIVLMLYAGYSWMTAAGDEQKVTKAKDTIRRAIIGLIIMVSSYAIWWFIFSKLLLEL